MAFITASEVDDCPTDHNKPQLERIGKSMKPGQRARFLYMRGELGVHAWDLPQRPDPASLDIARYTTLLLRAASTLLTPLSIAENDLQRWILSQASQPSPHWMPLNTMISSKKHLIP